MEEREISDAAWFISLRHNVPGYGLCWPLHVTWKPRMSFSASFFKIDQMNKRRPCIPVTRAAYPSCLAMCTTSTWNHSKDELQVKVVNAKFYGEHMNAALRVLLRGNSGGYICQILQDSVKIIPFIYSRVTRKQALIHLLCRKRTSGSSAYLNSVSRQQCQVMYTGKRSPLRRGPSSVSLSRYGSLRAVALGDLCALMNLGVATRLTHHASLAHKEARAPKEQGHVTPHSPLAGQRW